MSPATSGTTTTVSWTPFFQSQFFVHSCLSFVSNQLFPQVSPATATTVSWTPFLSFVSRCRQRQPARPAESSDLAPSSGSTNFFSLGGKVSRLVLVILISTQTQWLNQCEQTASKEMTDSSKIWPKLHRLLRNQKIDAVFHRNWRPVTHQRHQLSFYHVKTFKKHFITRKLSPRAGSRHHCALVCKPLSRAGTGRGAGAVTGRREAKGRISPGDTDQPAKLV